MKIKIINVDCKPEEDVMTLKECGFEVGDVIDVAGSYRDGRIYVNAIRATDVVSVGNAVSLDDAEYEVIEWETKSNV